jgi:hypothetical protein
MGSHPICYGFVEKRFDMSIQVDGENVSLYLFEHVSGIHGMSSMLISTSWVLLLF